MLETTDSHQVILSVWYSEFTEYLMQRLEIRQRLDYLSVVE
jgi:hypothetical protein